MTGWRITREHLWYALAFGLALALRFILLGSLPLSDTEAGLALQSLSISRGEHLVLSGQPASLLAAALLFFFSGASDFTARAWPALAGSLLVLAPFGFRDLLGRRAALILAFFLALDPALTALSRQAGSPVPALAFTLLAVGLWRSRKAALAGAAGALALLGGPSIWGGMLGLAITAGVYLLMDRAALLPAVEESSDATWTGAPTGFAWKRAGAAFLLTFGLAGTLFFLVPAGIAAFGASIPAYLQSWSSRSGVPAVRIAAALLGDELLFVCLAVWALVRGLRARDRLNTALGLWLLISLVVAALPTGRQVQDLAWMLVPLLILAARGLGAIHFAEEEDDRIPAWVYGGMTVFVLGFTWLNFSGMLVAWQQGDTTLQIRALAVGGGIILLAAATLLVAWGWSPGIASGGLLRGILLAGFIFTISAVTASANWRLQPPADLWGSYPRPEQARFLEETAGDLSYWKTGSRVSLDVVLVGQPSSSMRWYLRDFSSARVSPRLSLVTQPSLIITPQEQQPQLAAAYRGEALPWDVSPDWNAMGVFDWLNWAAFRAAPMQRGSVILWARTDIFLGANLSANGNP